VPSKTASLPTPDGVGSHEYEGLPPPGPDPGQPNPKQAIHRAQPGAAYRSLVHGDLVTQGEVLEGELAVAAEDEGEESKQVEQKSDHREPLAGRLRFRRRTGLLSLHPTATEPAYGSKKPGPPVISRRLGPPGGLRRIHHVGHAHGHQVTSVQGVVSERAPADLRRERVLRQKPAGGKWLISQR
jgi:hypothetical protein